LRFLVGRGRFELPTIAASMSPGGHGL